jgi:hypothetical protein
LLYGEFSINFSVDEDEEQEDGAIASSGRWGTPAAVKRWGTSPEDGYEAATGLLLI